MYRSQLQLSEVFQSFSGLMKDRFAYRRHTNEQIADGSLAIA